MLITRHFYACRFRPFFFGGNPLAAEAQLEERGTAGSYPLRHDLDAGDYAHGVISTRLAIEDPEGYDLTPLGARKVEVTS